MSSSMVVAFAATTSAAHSDTIPPKYRPVGVALAVGSGVLIGSSFVFKKKGLLSSQKGQVAGEGVAYLKSPLWWTGMIIMILGEACNLVAYSFLEAIIVTPMGALSVVVSAMLSHVILKEKLSLFGWISCIQCLLGATILALNGPEEQSVTTIAAFKKLFLAPGFLSYGSVIIAVSVVLALFVAPRWGHKSMLPSISICSLIGGLSVSCTQGLGACFVTTIRGENQFKNWFIYFLLAFVIITLLTEIYYLNVALAMFNTAMVTPTYYVMFTFCTLVTSVILYQGLKASATQIITIVFAFFVICTGIFILQMSKIDPRDLIPDGRTSLLLKAARAEVDPKAARQLERELTRGASLISRRSRRRRTPTNLSDPSQPRTPTSDIEGLPLTDNVNGNGNGQYNNHQPIEPGQAEGELSDVDELDADDDNVSLIEKTENPSIDSIRGSLGLGAIGSIIRARRRARTLRRSQTLRHDRDPEKAEGTSSFANGTGAASRVNGGTVLRPPSPRRDDSGASPVRSIRFAESDPVTPAARQESQDEMNVARVLPARSQTFPPPASRPTNKPPEEKKDDDANNEKVA